MSQPSILRLNLLRAGYLLLGVGMGVDIWPEIVRHPPTWTVMHGAAASMFGALTALAFIGLRYPLQMLPLLFFELAWKAIWLAAVALPLWSAHRLDAAHAQTANECLMAVIFLVLIPWDFVFRAYVLRPAEPCRGQMRRRSAVAAQT